MTGVQTCALPICKRYHYFKNLQGDIVGIVDGNGKMAAAYRYDAWGNHKVYDGNFRERHDTDFIGNINPFRYRGYYYDAETGLYYLQSRYYDPAFGRFINADDPAVLLDEDAGIIGGLNLYAYCNNNPVIFTDPSGYSAALLGFLIAGLIAGVTVGGIIAANAAYENGARGWDLFGWTLLGMVTGGIIGMGIGAAAYYIAPAIQHFMNSSFILFNTINAAGEAVAVTVTGAQIAAGAVALGFGLHVVFSKNADRFGSSKLGSNDYFNRQFDDFWNQFGDGNKKTRRSFHDYITKKGYDKWKQLIKAWEDFLRQRGLKP